MKIKQLNLVLYIFVPTLQAFATSEHFNYICHSLIYSIRFVRDEHVKQFWLDDPYMKPNQKKTVLC